MTNIYKIKTYVQNQLDDDKTGHDFVHIQRVVSLAKTIVKSEPTADELIVLTAAYLHDVIDDKLVDNTVAKQKEVQSQLRKLNYTSAQITAVMDIITHMSFSSNLKHRYLLSLEGQIVQDADRLDAIGAIGISRAMYFGGHFGDVIYDPNQVPRTNLDKTHYRQHTTVINHFYEKLFNLVDLMNTPLAKKLAQQRTAYMRNFVQEFKDEWQGHL